MTIETRILNFPTDITLGSICVVPEFEHKYLWGQTQCTGKKDSHTDCIPMWLARGRRSIALHEPYKLLFHLIGVSDENTQFASDASIFSRLPAEGIDILSGVSTNEQIAHTAHLINLQGLITQSCSTIDAEGLKVLATHKQMRYLHFDKLGGGENLSLLGDLENLEQLRIDLSGFEDNDFALLTPFRNLSTLHLGYCIHITDAGAMQLSKFKQLKSLHLASAELITDTGAGYLSELENLESLDISLSKVSSRAIADHFAKLTKLKELSICSPNFNLKVGDAGWKALTAMESLEKLHFNFLDLNYDNLLSLLALPNLKELYLAHTNVPPNDLVRIKQELLQSGVWKGFLDNEHYQSATSTIRYLRLTR